MTRLLLGAALVASTLIGCRISLDDASTPGACEIKMTSSCVAANDHQDLAWIEDNIFNFSCAFSNCHDGNQGSVEGRLDLRPGKSFAKLVNQSATADPHRMLVVPNDVHASYLMLMLHDFEPSEAVPAGVAPDKSIGYMPKDLEPLCCQKLDAIEHWIEAGAPSN